MPSKIKKPKMADLINSWVKWMENYGAKKFLKAFLSNAQGAQSTCIYCHCHIYLDVIEGGGVTDWKTKDGDYGCDESPVTRTTGCGSHFPVRL